MRKTSIIMGLALALSIGGAGIASAQSGTRPERPRGAAQDSGFRRGRGGPEAMLLRGITLSAEQKTRVAALRSSQRQQMQARAGQAGRPHERGDTTGFGARRAQMAQAREQHFAQLRSILNDSQRAQFDKNVAEVKAGVAHGGRNGGDGSTRARRPGSDRQARGANQSR